MNAKQLALALVFVLVAASCGGDSDDASDDTSSTVADTGDSTDSGGIAGGGGDGGSSLDDGSLGGNAIGSLDQVQNATVQIVAEGSFVDPAVGLVLNASGAGSGFLIDPSGIAVTNNHVVTGAAFLEVYVAGESTPRDARVLGVSECSDLAVIDIDGDDFSYLDWYPGSADVGLEIYAAGFPLGDPEFTLTRGIVSKANADGDTNWASVPSVLEHDATINPGNSGGPLVSGDGQVVGVNYAGSSDTNQYFAISAAEAQDVVAQLRAGNDVDSIGVNGTAVASEADGIFGVWVASVESGSPADLAGVQPGDIITELEGLVLSTDGTMADYCSILRSRNASDVMKIRVLRFETGQILSGSLNGEPLAEVAALFADAAEATGGEVSSGAASNLTFEEIRDDSGLLSMSVPVTWTDRNGSGLTDNAGLGLSAAPDLDQALGFWDAPGVFFYAFEKGLEPAGSFDGLLDAFSVADQCGGVVRDDYDDGLYTGRYDLYEACGGLDTAYGVVAADSPGSAYTVVFIFQAVDPTDVDAAVRALETFIINE